MLSVLMLVSTQAMLNGLAFLGLLFLLQVLFRRKAPALGGVILAVAVLTRSPENPWLTLPLAAASAVVLVAALVRFGLLAFVAGWYALIAVSAAPRHLDLSQWYGINSAVALGFFLAVAAGAFHTSLGGRPILGAALLDD
jgi:hypothetical protein